MNKAKHLAYLLASSILLSILLVISCAAPKTNSKPSNTKSLPNSPAIISISNLTIKPLIAQQNEPVTISIDVTNSGGTEGSHTATLMVNGKKEAEQTFVLAGGRTEAFKFSVTREAIATYKVAIGALNGAFTVVSSVGSITGTDVPELVSFDRIITQIMNKRKIPGGSVAVVKEGRLVLARGYGFADVENKEPVKPDSLFRIGSISKPITAVAVLKLIEQGRLNLDEKTFPLLGYTKSTTPLAKDARIYDITIRNLLQHSGGWDATQSFDPMFLSDRIAQSVGVSAPANSEAIISYMLGQQLNFDPGKRYMYSNFGYCVLGRVIEKVTGQSYSDYINTQILRPMGIDQMRIGHSLADERAENEVKYYDYPGAPLVKSVFPGYVDNVPNQYGGFYLEAIDSAGGWIASSINLVRFLNVLNSGKPDPVLKPETVGLMVSRPAPPLWSGESFYYGMGLLVRPQGNDANWWHTGAVAGTSAIFVRANNGCVWGLVFNSRPNDKSFLDEIDFALWRASGEVTKWPVHDLFKQYDYK